MQFFMQKLKENNEMSQLTLNDLEIEFWVNGILL